MWNLEGYKHRHYDMLFLRDSGLVFLKKSVYVINITTHLPLPLGFLTLFYLEEKYLNFSTNYLNSMSRFLLILMCKHTYMWREFLSYRLVKVGLFWFIIVSNRIPIYLYLSIYLSTSLLTFPTIYLYYIDLVLGREDNNNCI